MAQSGRSLSGLLFLPCHPDGLLRDKPPIDGRGGEEGPWASLCSWSHTWGWWSQPMTPPTMSLHVGSSHFGSAITPYWLWLSGILRVVRVQESQLNLSTQATGRPGEGSRGPAQMPQDAYLPVGINLHRLQISISSTRGFPNKMPLLEGCRIACQVSFLHLFTIQ